MRKKKRKAGKKCFLQEYFWLSLSLVLPADATISVVSAALDSNYYVYIHTLEPRWSLLEVTVNGISFPHDDGHRGSCFSEKRRANKLGWWGIIEFWKLYQDRV